jgi:hypothetical protein
MTSTTTKQRVIRNGVHTLRKRPAIRPTKPVGPAHMSPEKLRMRMEQVYAENYWRLVLASATGKSYAAICRYATGETPIPKWLVLVVNLLTNRDEAVRVAIERARENAPDRVTKRTVRSS